MDTLRAPTALASLVAANVTPLAGIVLFGWSPASLLILYYVDTFLGLGAVVLLVMAHVTGNDHGRPFSGWKDWAKACSALVFFGAIMALPMFFPIFIVVGDGPEIEALLTDRTFVYAILAQVAMSGLAVVRQHRMLKARDDDDRILAGRFLFLVARWMVMFVAIATGFIALLGPKIGGAILVAIYAGASVYFELFPERAARLVRGKDTKPITFTGDLDGPAPSDGAVGVVRRECPLLSASSTANASHQAERARSRRARGKQPRPK